MGMRIEKDGAVHSVVERRKEFINLRLNVIEWEKLDQAKQILQQPKDSTAIKQLVDIATIVLHDEKMMKIVNIIIENKRKNKRMNIIDFE